MIDRYTNVTVGAGMVNEVNPERHGNTRVYSQAEKELNFYIRNHYPEWNCEGI